MQKAVKLIQLKLHLILDQPTTRTKSGWSQKSFEHLGTCWVKTNERFCILKKNTQKQVSFCEKKVGLSIPKYPSTVFGVRPSLVGFGISLLSFCRLKKPSWGSFWLTKNYEKVVYASSTNYPLQKNIVFSFAPGSFWNRFFKKKHRHIDPPAASHRRSILPPVDMAHVFPVEIALSCCPPYPS